MIKSGDVSNQIRDSVLSDATRIGGANLNTFAGDDPGGTIAGSAQAVTIAGYIDTEVAAIKTQTDKLTFTGSYLQADVVDRKGATGPAMTGDAYARLGAPVGASVSADIAALKTTSGGGCSVTRSCLSNP